MIKLIGNDENQKNIKIMDSRKEAKSNNKTEMAKTDSNGQIDPLNESVMMLNGIEVDFGLQIIKFYRDDKEKTAMAKHINVVYHISKGNNIENDELINNIIHDGIHNIFSIRGCYL